ARPHQRQPPMTHHRSRLLQFVIDVDDLDRGVAFWSAALHATEEQLSERSRPIYRLLRLPDAEIRILLQRTDDAKVSKERMHLGLETDNIEAEGQRLEALGATRYDHQQERGFDFWVLRDPWGNEFCVLHPNFPELLARRRPWRTYRPLRNRETRGPCSGPLAGKDFGAQLVVSLIGKPLLGREGEGLVGKDSVGIADHVTVALKDLGPAAGIPQF